MCNNDFMRAYVHVCLVKQHKLYNQKDDLLWVTGPLIITKLYSTSDPSWETSQVNKLSFEQVCNIIWRVTITISGRIVFEVLLIIIDYY